MSLTTKAIDPLHFRKALGHFASGLTVITSQIEDEPIGFTCQSFYSVSTAPPLVQALEMVPEFPAAVAEAPSQRLGALRSWCWQRSRPCLLRTCLRRVGRSCPHSRCGVRH